MYVHGVVAWLGGMFGGMSGGMFMGMIVPMLHRSPNVWVRQRHGHPYGKLPCNLGPEVNTLRRVMSARGEALVLSCLASFYPDY